MSSPVYETPPRDGCECPPGTGFGVGRSHSTANTRCPLNKTKCSHAHAHHLMERCGWCGFVSPDMVAVPMLELEKLLQHIQTRPCCGDAAKPIRDRIKAKKEANGR